MSEGLLPDEQYLIACEAVAHRMLEDPAYAAMCDYDRMLRRYDIPAPQGHFTPESFNASLADLLRKQHRHNAHPLDQTLVNGSQTSRSLLLLNDPLIKSLCGGLEGAVRASRCHPLEDLAGFTARRCVLDACQDVRLLAPG